MSLNYNNYIKENDLPTNLEKFIFEGVVKKIDDPNDTGRIQVFIDGIDNGIELNSLPFAYPLLGINNKIPLNIGETVRVFIKDLSHLNKSDNNRLWVGPILSNELYLQKQSLNNPTLNDSDFYQIGNNDKLEKNITTEYRGRGNTRLIFSGDSTSLISNYLNDKNVNNKPTLVSLEKNTAKVISDDIFLLTRNSNINPSDPNIKELTHPLVFGDLLIEIIKLQNNIIINHIHPHSQKEPVKSNDIKKLIEMTNNIESILSKGIKIN